MRNIIVITEWSFNIQTFGRVYKINYAIARYITGYKNASVISLTNVSFETLIYRILATAWTRVTGDPPCNPWQDPKRLLKGKCYKSFKKREIKESVIEFCEYQMTF